MEQPPSARGKGAGRTVPRPRRDPLRTPPRSAELSDRTQTGTEPKGHARPGQLPSTSCGVAGFSARGAPRNTRRPELGAYFNRGEKKADLLSGILERVGPVNRIRLDRLGKILTNCAGSGICGISRPHYLAVERH